MSEEKLADVVLSNETDDNTNTITYLGIKIKVRINPLCPRQLIAISGLLGQLPELKDEDQTMFHALLDNANSLKLVCKSISIATGHPFKWLIYLAVMRIPLKDIKTFMDMMIVQSNAAFFLNIMASGKNLNVLKNQEKQEGQ